MTKLGRQPNLLQLSRSIRHTLSTTHHSWCSLLFLLFPEHCNAMKAQLATLHWLATFVSKCLCGNGQSGAVAADMFANSLARGTTIRLAHAVTTCFTTLQTLEL